MININLDEVRDHGMSNYTSWDHWIPDHSVVDDGFGNLHDTDLGIFWYNVDRMRDMGVH